MPQITYRATLTTVTNLWDDDVDPVAEVIAYVLLQQLGLGETSHEEHVLKRANLGGR